MTQPGSEKEMVGVRVLGELALEVGGRPGEPESQATGRARCSPGSRSIPGFIPGAASPAVFWPEVLEESARSSLRTTLATLKRELGKEAAGVVTATRERVGIEPGPEAWIDLQAFEQLVSRGELQQAAALCRGICSRISMTTGCTSPASTTAIGCSVLLGQLAEEAERSGDLDTALHRTREQVSLDPLSEEAQRQLVAPARAAGDRAGAPGCVPVSTALRLQRELGIAPRQGAVELISRSDGEAGQDQPVNAAGAAVSERISGVRVIPSSQPIPVPEVSLRAERLRLPRLPLSFGEGDLEFVFVPGLVLSTWSPLGTIRPIGLIHGPARSSARVTVYDKRGMGLSDPLDTAAGFDQHLDDLAVVIDAFSSR